MMKTAFVLGVFLIAMPGCGSAKRAHEAALFYAQEECYEVREALGQPITGAFNSFEQNGTGRAKSIRGSGSIRGPKGDGAIDYAALGDGETWSITAGSVAINGKAIDLVACAAKRAKPSAQGHAVPPHPTAKIGAVTVDPAVEGAANVVAALESRFRRCYAGGVSEAPTMKGAAVVTARVNESGVVTSVQVASNSGVTSEVAECAADALRHATFARHKGADATVTVPLQFTFE